ncbi:MAG TPA: endonuclease domain-containing protein [Dehalococcoidia bacterium]|nr:endonuclease domain-containing protein [Dehalococcoidia bacterium]
MTDAESRLWYNLRRHGLEGYKFRRQHPFGPYILDFYCPEAGLVVELDRGQHSEFDEMTHDSERTTYLPQGGLRVLRFTDTEALLETDAVLDRIHAALETPLPNPLPGGARGQVGG